MPIFSGAACAAGAVMNDRPNASVARAAVLRAKVFNYACFEVDCVMVVSVIKTVR